MKNIRLFQAFGLALILFALPGVASAQQRGGEHRGQRGDQSAQGHTQQDRQQPQFHQPQVTQQQPQIRERGRIERPTLPSNDQGRQIRQPDWQRTPQVGQQPNVDRGQHRWDNPVVTQPDRNHDGRGPDWQRGDRGDQRRVPPVATPDRNHDGQPDWQRGDRGDQRRVPPVVTPDRNHDGQPDWQRGDRGDQRRVPPVVTPDRNRDRQPDGQRGGQWGGNDHRGDDHRSNVPPRGRDNDHGWDNDHRAGNEHNWHNNDRDRWDHRPDYRSRDLNRERERQLHRYDGPQWNHIHRGQPAPRYWAPVYPRVDQFCRPVYGSYRGRWNAPGYVSIGGISLSIGYHSGFYFSGTYYSGGAFFAFSNYGPTEWVYEPAWGRWYRPGYGYVYRAPAYTQPITVVVVETVYYETWDDTIGGYVETSEQATWYYNAFYVPEAGRYGYYDYQGDFNWLNY